MCILYSSKNGSKRDEFGTRENTSNAVFCIDPNIGKKYWLILWPIGLLTHWYALSMNRSTSLWMKFSEVSVSNRMEN